MGQRFEKEGAINEENSHKEVVLYRGINHYNYYTREAYLNYLQEQITKRCSNIQIRTCVSFKERRPEIYCFFTNLIENKRKEHVSTNDSHLVKKTQSHAYSPNLL